MKNVVIHIILFFLPIVIIGQDINEIIGTVSFKSSKNVYIRFTNTSEINVGDTLWVNKGLDQWEKSLVVKQKSSTSCVTENLNNVEINIGHQVKHMSISMPEKVAVDPKKEIEIAITPDSVVTENEQPTKNKKQITTGRVTFSTNASINPGQQSNFQRIRAGLTLNIQNIQQSDFSFQSYVTYRHRYGIDQVNTDFYDDFKIFNLSVQYKPSEAFNITLGRKMNSNIANMGVIDGVQSEYTLGKYTGGLFIGTRPDFSNYTFNTSLPQVGAYLVRTDRTNEGMAQTSIAIAEQQNDFKTDRRFIYFQHSNGLVKNLNLFFSTELDLYKKINEVISNQPQLTSIYASLRYRLRKNLSVSGSYDNRRNVIYYESYQTFIDQLLAQETRQGFRLQANYSPFKKVNINTSAFFRYQGNNPVPTKNFVANLNFNGVLRKGLSTSLSLNLLESYYFKGTIAGARISENFLKGKLNTEINYRNINYTFFNTESALKQHIAGVNFSINVLKKTTLMCSYEGTFEPSRAWHRYFITITQRIKN
ncbi:MAG TPA: hypothetical protein PKD16_13380 [Saprospiraceae bacterium]|nr:hypothetical protein [Saprospiraceae bacterium]